MEHKVFRSIFFTSLFSVIFISCEKDVAIDLGSSEDKVVIEGVIESGLQPYVRLSKSIGFFSTIDLKTLSESFLQDAEIFVSNGERSIKLREYSFRNSGVDYYFYSIDTADATAYTFKGETGKTYTLEIRYGGKTYHSSTTIPELTPLDSLWAAPLPPEEMPEEYPDAMMLHARYTDPPDPGNRIRYFTSSNGGTFTSPFYSVYNDEIINGSTVNIQLNAGVNKMDSINNVASAYFFLKGDYVIVKWCSIDKATFDFWRTLEFSYGSTGNPFAAPVQITTNINGGALGIWAGYGVSYDTLQIPK